MRSLTSALAGACLLAPSIASASDADPWFGRDKVLHFGASAALATTGYAVGAMFFDDVPPRLATGATLALGAGVAKELADLAGAGHASWRDFAWDVAGTGAGLLFAWGVDSLFFAPAGSAESDAKLVTLQGRF